MPLTQVGMNANLTWALQNASAAFGPSSQGPLTLAFSLANINFATVNQIYTNALTLGSGANADADFYSFTNGVGESTGFLHIQAIFVTVTAASASSVTLGNGSANPLVWFFGGTAPTITIPPGGMFMFSVPVGGTLAVVSSTVRKFNFLDGGSGSTTNILALGSTT